MSADFDELPAENYTPRVYSTSPKCGEAAGGCKRLTLSNLEQHVPPDHVQALRSKKGYTPKYPETVAHDVYFNPLFVGKEVFVKREDIPSLEPMWGEDKGEAKHKVYDYLNNQNLRVVSEIATTSPSSPHGTMLLYEINAHNPM